MSEPRYATLADLRSLTGVTTGDDSRLTAALLAAEELIDTYCRRRFTAPDVNEDDPTVRVYPAAGYIDDVVHVDTVETRPSASAEWTELAADRWELGPVNATADGKPYTQLVARRSPIVADAVRITGWFGWPAVPAVVTQATLLQASRLYQRKNAAFGVAPVPGLEGSGGMRLLAKLDADVELLLAGVRRHAVLVG